MDPNNPNSPFDSQASTSSPSTTLPPGGVDVQPTFVAPAPANQPDSGVAAPLTDPVSSLSLGTTPSFSPPAADPMAPSLSGGTSPAPFPPTAAENAAPSWTSSEAAPPFGQTVASNPAVTAEPSPTFMPPTEMSGTQGSIIGGSSVGEIANPLANPSPLEVNNEVAGGLDTAPTDLSHLVGSNGVEENPAGISLPPAAPPDTLTGPSSVASPSGSGDVVTSGSVGFPKWLILIGLLVLLAVGGGSAYFILGIGKPVSQAPVEVPVEDSGPGSGTFVPTEENLPGATADPNSNLVNMELATPTPSTVTATGSSTATNSSALELLKKRKSQ